jgi:hypothetical protein
MMAEQLKPCPHCQGTDLKILPRNYIDGGGFVLTCQNGGCIARIWGHDEADVVARWNRRTPGPATAAMLDRLRMLEVWKDSGAFPEEYPGTLSKEEISAFLAEWLDPATPPTPEQPKPSPWRCSLCGKPVRIGDDLQPHHLSYVGYAHTAELSDADKKILADGLGLND